jgi:ABC-2 type transport system ATP-binding protein
VTIIITKRGSFMSHAIVTHDLTKTYGANRGIRDINLRIEKGEIFGFLGPNGAGKSTTLRTLIGLMKPTSGLVEILGLDPHSQTTEVLARIGNLPTEFSLDDRMSGRQMLRLFSRLRGGVDLAYADEIAERLDADLDRPMRRLSRGNKQKIGIIQALYHRPELIILDEPTGGLDPIVQENFLAILLESRERGQTIFFSSHVLSEVERIADRVGIIRDGVMVAVEDPRQLTGSLLRRVILHLADHPDSGFLEALDVIPGLDQISVDGTSMRFQVTGDIDPLIKLLATRQVTALDMERPSLEEIFLTYYESADSGATAS